MSKIRIGMGVNELNLKPEIAGSVQLSEDMQQTLAFLVAMGVTGRQVLKCSEGGILYTGSARVKDTWNFASTGADEDKVGDNIACTECQVIAHPDNTNRLWVKPYGVASVDDGVPLDAGDSFGFTINNLNQLNINFVASGDKSIVVYSI